VKIVTKQNQVDQLPTGGTGHFSQSLSSETEIKTCLQYEHDDGQHEIGNGKEREIG
jgi:hypothetical protein